jgi:tRNA-dihydrouridine synthase
MVGRGAMGNPYLFTQCDSWLNKHKKAPDMDDAARGNQLLDFIKLYKDVRVQKMYRWPELKQHALWFCTGAKGAAEKRRELAAVEDDEQLVKNVKSLFSIA